MTVAELIEQLQQCPPELDVWVEGSECCSFAEPGSECCGFAEPVDHVLALGAEDGVEPHVVVAG